MAFPRLVEHFLDAGAFTKAEAAAFLGRRPDYAINNLRKAGYIRIVRRGLYVFDPERTRREADKYVIASKVRRDAVIAYGSTLDLLGASHSAFRSVVYATAAKAVRPFTYGRMTYRILATHPAWTQQHLHQRVKRSGQPVVTAGPELAIVQCLLRPEYAEGFDALMHGLQVLPAPDWPTLLTLVAAQETYGRAALARRLGFVAQHFQRAWGTPPSFLEALQGQVGRGATYFGTTRKQGSRWVARWNLAIPKSFAIGEQP